MITRDMMVLFTFCLIWRNISPWYQVSSIGLGLDINLLSMKDWLQGNIREAILATYGGISRCTPELCRQRA